MNQTRTYEWEFDLDEYTMTKDVAEDYIAKVKTGKTCTEEDIIRDIVAERTDIRPETLRMCNQLMGDKIIQKLCQGHIVATTTSVFSPSIPGVFMGTSGRIDAEKNVCVINITSSDALRKALALVKPKYSGHVRTLGGARISLIRDVTTGKTDGSITSGGMLDVTGNKIRCINADGTGIGIARFLKADTREEVATVPLIGINDPSRLVFNAPALEDGSYLFQVETCFSNSALLLKQPRVIEYPIVLYVGERPSSGGSGEEERPGEL